MLLEVCPATTHHRVINVSVADDVSMIIVHRSCAMHHVHDGVVDVGR